MSKPWKRGRGKLGFMQPLLGRWVAEAQSEIGPMRCTRVFEPVLGGSFIRLQARWVFGARTGLAGESAGRPLPKGSRAYEEVAFIGAGEGGVVSFWSFTSDGKRSQGMVADVSDVHEQAIGFEARMPAGLARMVYWPADNDGFLWAVESRTAKGWKRFLEHCYHRE